MSPISFRDAYQPASKPVSQLRRFVPAFDREEFLGASREKEAQAERDKWPRERAPFHSEALTAELAQRGHSTELFRPPGS